MKYKNTWHIDHASLSLDVNKKPIRKCKPTTKKGIASSADERCVKVNRLLVAFLEVSARHIYQGNRSFLFEDTIRITLGIRAAIAGYFRSKYHGQNWRLYGKSSGQGC